MDYAFGSQFEKDLHRDIKILIETGYDRARDEAEFNDIALRLFRFQYENCEPYKRFCDSKNLTPTVVDKWEHIPALPADAFKYNDIACFPLEKAERVFMTSGTSDPQKRGRSYRDASNMELFDAAVKAAYAQYLAPDDRRMKGILISPPPDFMPESPIMYDIGLLVDGFATEAMYAIGRGGFDMGALLASLRQAEATGEPIIFGGASFGFIPFLDLCRAEGMSFRLPEGSRSVDGGGYKGRSRGLPKDEFIALTSEILGIPDECIINLLGLTESASVYLDNVFMNRIRGVTDSRYKLNHPWTRTVVIDPETLREPVPRRLPKGERGILRHCDLANRSTVMAIQTEDIGYEIGDGFEIIERGTGIAGCSLAIEEYIEATNE